VSDEEEKEVDDVVLVPDDKYSAQSLDKMITLVAVLVEKSRIDRQLHLSVRDTQALIGGGKVCIVIVSELCTLTGCQQRTLSSHHCVDWNGMQLLA